MAENEIQEKKRRPRKDREADVKMERAADGYYNQGGIGFEIWRQVQHRPPKRTAARLSLFVFSRVVFLKIMKKGRPVGVLSGWDA